MIKLFKFGPNFGVPDPSPFVMKLETYLRLADIEYETVYGDVRKAPKAKFPCVEFDGEMIGDSELIIQKLKQKFGDPLGDGVTEKMRAEAHMMRLALENHSYFLALTYRWLRDENSPKIQKAYFSKLGLKGKLIFKLVQREFTRTIYGQGLLRHTREEMDEMIRADIEALETLLGGDNFFGGERPREIDATTFAFAANMIVPDFEGPFAVISRRSKNLVAYHNRMTEKVFPDYKDTMLYGV